MNLFEAPTIEQKDIREPESVQDTVRVIALTMAESSSLVDQMVPAAHQTDQNGLITFPPPMPECTTMIWKQKGETSRNPDELMLPGGAVESKTRSNPTTDEITDAAQQKLWLNSHLFAGSIRQIPGQRTYDLPAEPGSAHVKRYIERLVVVTCPPCDTVAYFRNDDKIRLERTLKPHDLSELLTYDEYSGPDGVTGWLVDSLSNDKRRMETHGVVLHDDSADRIKLTIEEEAYIYEAGIQREVISHILSLTKSQSERSEHFRDLTSRLFSFPLETYDDAQAIMTVALQIAGSIEEGYDPKTLAQAKPLDHPQYRSLLLRGVDPDRLSRRALLIEEMQRAFELVSLQQTVELTRETGTQQPFIIAQELARLTTVTPREYAIVKENPYIKHMIDTVCALFDTTPESEGWYETVRAGFINIRNLRHKKGGPELLQQHNQKLIALYTDPSDSRVPKLNPANLGHASQKANEFLTDLREPFKPILDKATLRSLLPDPYGSMTSEIIELFSRMVGVSQYRPLPGTHHERQDHLSPAEKKAAWTKLMLIEYEQTVSEIQSREANAHIYPLREAFAVLFNERGVPTDPDTMGHYQYELDRSVYDRWAREEEDRVFEQFGIEPRTIPIVVYSNIDDKSDSSAMRKYIERGVVDDSFRLFIALDTNQMAAFLPDEVVHQQLTGDPAKDIPWASVLTDLWVRWATRVILESREQYLYNVYDEQDPIFRRYDVKISPAFGSLTRGNSDTGGSGASNITFEWLKFCEEVVIGGTSYVGEIQISTVHDLSRKHADDERYALERVFTPPRNRPRYPLARVMYGMREAYPVLMKKFYEWKAQFTEIMRQENHQAAS